jgi:hypothetical protein
LKAIEAERKIAHGELARIVGGERAMELQGVAGEFDGGFERKSVRAGDFEPELTGVALRRERESEEEKDEVEQFSHIWEKFYGNSIGSGN